MGNLLCRDLVPQSADPQYFRQFKTQFILHPSSEVSFALSSRIDLPTSKDQSTAPLSNAAIYSFSILASG